jgi:hypothetical protein
MPIEADRRWAKRQESLPKVATNAFLGRFGLIELADGSDRERMESRADRFTALP